MKATGSIIASAIFLLLSSHIVLGGVIDNVWFLLLLLLRPTDGMVVVFIWSN